MNESETATAESNRKKGTTKDTEAERIAEIIHEAIDRFTVQAAEAEQRVRDAADDVQTRVRTSRQRARTRVYDTTEAVEEYIDDHPWAALGIAFGAGIVLSSLLRR